MEQFYPLIILMFTIFAGYQLFRYITYVKENKRFLNAFNEFNKNRINPINESGFRRIYEYQNNFAVLYLTQGKVGGGNQRNGDELMENKERDCKARIKDHLDLAKSNSTISSLGYNFNSKENFMSFVTSLFEVMPNQSSRIFPVNQTWVVVSKNNNSIGISLDSTLFC